MRFRSRVAALAAVLFALAPGSRLAAQDRVIELTADQVKVAETAMSQLRSPVTPSHTVEMCPSTGALRDSIRVAAAGGASAEEIVEDVIGRHGEHIRILPKRSGAGLIAWLATPLLLLLGGGLIVARVRRDSATSEPEPRGAPEITDDERARLAAAMREMDDSEGLDP